MSSTPELDGIYALLLCIFNKDYSPSEALTYIKTGRRKVEKDDDRLSERHLRIIWNMYQRGENLKQISDVYGMDYKEVDCIISVMREEIKNEETGYERRTDRLRKTEREVREIVRGGDF